MYEIKRALIYGIGCTEQLANMVYAVVNKSGHGIVDHILQIYKVLPSIKDLRAYQEL